MKLDEEEYVVLPEERNFEFSEFRRYCERNSVKVRNVDVAFFSWLYL